MSREIQKEDRKRRILDAAEALIRKTGTTEFSMAVLAERASLSGPTPYNLFGSKGGILYALLNRSVDGLFSDIARGRGKSTDPVEMVLHAAQTAGDEFASDPRFYRPLYQFLLGIHDPVHRPAYMDRALFYWKQALLHLAEAGQLPDVISHDQIARMMVVNTLGALDLWVQSELDDDQFRAQVLYGTAVLLYSVANAAQRDHLSARLRVSCGARPDDRWISRTVRRPSIAARMKSSYGVVGIARSATLGSRTGITSGRSTREVAPEV